MTALRLAVLAIAIAAPARAADVAWTAVDVHQAADTARHSREVTCIFQAEIGGVGFNPYAPHGDERIYGPGGLASNGLLPQFTAWGYEDRYDPYEVAEYIDRVLDEGRGQNWPYLSGRLRSGAC